MTLDLAQTPVVEGYGLTLRPWDEGLVRQMAAWGERGFPYHAFDLGYLRDPGRAAGMLAWARENGPHRHFVACEGETAVGRFSVNLRDESGLYLWSVHVPPEHDGRGVCRRMLAAAMTFAEHAQSAYTALGFAVSETRWHYDREIAEVLWKVPPVEREPIAKHIRFQAGRWEVRTHVMRRRRGAPMDTGAKQQGRRA